MKQIKEQKGFTGNFFNFTYNEFKELIIFTFVNFSPTILFLDQLYVLIWTNTVELSQTNGVRTNKKKYDKRKNHSTELTLEQHPSDFFKSLNVVII